MMLRMRNLYLIGLIVFLNVSVGDFAPLAQDKLPSKEMENFMKRFGYIDSKPSTDADAMYTEEGFKTIIQQMQRFGGLPETGELDEATLNLTKSPRCGVPDVIRNHRQKRYIIGSSAWRKKHLTYFLANWPGEMDAEMTRSKLAKALNLWSEITPLRFQPRESMDADLIIAFGRSEHGDGYPFDGRGNILAHAFFPYEHGSYGGDIHFDDDEQWIDGSRINNNADGVDFYTVAAHEIGHSLGLAHSTVPGSIMFPYYKGYDPNMRLDYDDIVAMYSMYVADAHFEDESIPQPAPTEEPHWDDKYRPRDRDRDRNDDDDGFYPASDEPPKDDDDIHRSDESEADQGGEADKDDGYESNDDDYYNSYTTLATEIETESEAKATIAYTEVPYSTESSSVVTPSPTAGTRKPPDLCEGSIDAASVIRGELFVFKGMYVWRLGERNKILRGYPVYFHHFFMGFPWSVRSIDAVYQRPEDYHIVFFTGRFYWIFDGNRFTSDSPHHLTELGIPADVEKLDAAIVWQKNKKTYFFSDDMYWRYDEQKKKMEKGYPQRLARWKGVPKVDAAFTYTDGKTYFFSGKHFWRFNNKNISVDTGFPLETGPYWFDCTS